MTQSSVKLEPVYPFVRPYPCFGERLSLFRRRRYGGSGACRHLDGVASAIIG
ncbi:hypothetical protein WN51_04533 [Melipona quadrifasciata]|uniref:Uncharacterized protein n=1 Tax=Melipona quadrifasciata TaxID=166423 RepID=A0A0N0BD69_9HYME|nr:hypothetical protein WN51_04533 [Melipona quadrifasciata]